MKLGALAVLIGIGALIFGACCYSVNGDTATAISSEKAASISGEKTRVETAVNSFLEAASNRDWLKAEALLTEESLEPFRDEIENGSNPGKSVYRVLTYCQLRIESIDLQGNKARVRVMTKPGPSNVVVQRVGLELNLVRVDANWRIFYPLDGSGKTSSAATSGNKDTALLVSMISDGVLSDQEKTELEPILKNYYAIQLISKVGDNKIWEDVPSSTKEISEAMTERPNYKPSDAVLWKVPDEKTQKESAKLAKAAVDEIYKELAAAKDKYYELNTFTKEKVTFTDGKFDKEMGINYGFDYSPVKPVRGMMIAKPNILIHISKFIPGLERKVQACLPGPALPAQMLQIKYNVYVDDEELKTFANEVIKKNIQPLLDREKALGGESGYFSVDL